MAHDDRTTPWTTDGAVRLRAAAAELAASVIAHAEALPAVTGEAGIDAGFAATERLLPAVLAYADVQFDYTGYSFPLRGAMRAGPAAT